jgi:hypothetical protein
MSAFNWKVIEEKPDNYADVRLLIEDAITESEDASTESKTNIIRQSNNTLTLFAERFEFTKFFTKVMELEEKTSKKLSKKELIIRENEIKVINADFEQFKMEKNGNLIQTHFQQPINIFLYFFWWFGSLLRKLKSKEHVSSIVLLDAALSLGNILESGYLNEFYLEGFEKISKIFEKIVNDDFYNILFDNPKFLYHTSFQHFQQLTKLYPEQRLILDKIHHAVENNEPLLLGNQMPTGQGKTFLSIPLAKMLSMEKRKEKKKCVLFACSNPLVNIDVAQNALVGADIHLWMAKLMKVKDEGPPKGPYDYILDGIYSENKNLEIMDIWSMAKQRNCNIMKDDVRKWYSTRDSDNEIIQNKKVLLRPYKRCFPSIWKKVYRNKEDDKRKNGSIVQQWSFYSEHTGKIPDIMIADLDACLLLLKNQDKLGYPFIPYIDEFISDSISNKKMAEICKYLPRQSVLLSSVLPTFDSIPNIVKNFCDRHSCRKEEACYRVSTSDVNIPCCIIDANGFVRFPHHQIQNLNDVDELLLQIEKNPRVRRTYSSKHVYFWSKTLESELPKEIQFKSIFPTIWTIHPRKTINYVLTLLTFLRDNFHLLELFQSYRPSMMSSIKKEDLFTKQTHEYDPKTLVVLKTPLVETIDLTKGLFENSVKMSTIIQQTNKTKQTMQKRIENLKERKISTKDKRNVTASKQKIQDELEDAQENAELIQVEIPKSMVLNHTKHFEKYNPGKKCPKTVSSLTSVLLPDNYFDHFSNDELYQILSGIGTYDTLHQTEYQRSLLMRLYSNFLFFVSGKDIVYGTNLAKLTNIFLDKDFVDTINTCELYQLIGRVGRMGRSYNANIIASDESVVERCLSFDDSYEKDNEIEKNFMINADV